jgi:5-methylcytosine-specific restriction endonuclease McrA
MASFYSTREWRKVRRFVLIANGFVCSNPRCGKPIDGKGRAHVHHQLRLKQHPGAALLRANLKPLCAACHNREHGPEKGRARGCTIDGTPLDPQHPWNQDARRRAALGA